MAMEMQSGGKMMGFLVILLVLFIEMAAPTSASRNSFSTQILEVQNQLKLLNKPAVKSIKVSQNLLICSLFKLSKSCKFRLIFC